MILKMLVVAMMIALPAQGKGWTHEDTFIELSCFFVMTLDWGQTRTIAINDEWHELNPVLGKYPDVQTVDTYFAVCFVGHALIAYSLPEKQRKLFQSATIILESGAVGHNYALGIKVRFW